jgi:hypothetical protein
VLSLAAAAALAIVAGGAPALATEPCGDFGECKVLIEINASDGDIGFHFLMDADDLNSARIEDPSGSKIFEDKAKGALVDQKLTETFAESSEPLCWPDPEADPEDLEEIVTLADFTSRWLPGTYSFLGQSDEGEMLEGESELTFNLPAAPAGVDFDGSRITWAAGDDLGNCGGSAELAALVPGTLPVHPELVPVAAWEIVMEPDVEDGDPAGSLKFSIRVPGDIAVKAVTVPADYLASLDQDTPVKIEVGAIGLDDNATFTEADGFCVNEVAGCEEEE